jgi:ferredoxin--NADP+ reductase
VYKIVKKNEIGLRVHSYEIYAPEVAKSAKAGQFVILRIDDKGERIPLTISGVSCQESLVRIIFQEIGKSTSQLALLNEGDYIKDFAGPLGHPAEVKKYGTVVAVAGGVGAAEVLPIIKGFKKIGNKIVTILGARNKDLIILEDELKQESDTLFFVTNDGTYGTKGIVTDVLKDVMDKENINLVYTIGPIQMMKSVAELTKGKCIKTIASLNPIMLDGTGMCGACRVTVDGKIKFACVDGPEFDAHTLQWAELVSRQNLFKNLEKISLDNFRCNGNCKCHKN